MKRVTFRSSLLIAWQGVRRRPLRNALTALSLLVGVVSIVLIQGAGDTMREAIVRDALLSHGPKPTLLVSLDKTHDPRQTAAWWKHQLTTTTRESDGTASVMVQLSDAEVYSGGSRAGSMDVIATDADMRSIRPFPVLHGRWFEEPSLTPQFVVNKAAWEHGEWSSGPSGTVELGTEGSYERTRMRLVGVVDDASSEPQAYVNLADNGTAWRSALFDGHPSMIVLHSPTLDETGLRSRVTDLATRAERTGEIREINRIDQIDTFTEQLQTNRKLFLGIAALSLVVGSLGILNVGLATLRERADELSLRRSFGASRTQVLTIMILESQIVALAAAAMAVGLAAAGVPAVLSRIGSEHTLNTAGVPVTAALLGVAASSTAAFLGALAPALRTARVPIASIMR
ncbi:ABC transporter permease [Actinomycetota bacterium Odt1-20B]